MLVTALVLAQLQPPRPSPGASKVEAAWDERHVSSLHALSVQAQAALRDESFRTRLLHTPAAAVELSVCGALLVPFGGYMLRALEGHLRSFDVVSAGEIGVLQTGGTQTQGFEHRVSLYASFAGALSCTTHAHSPHALSDRPCRCHSVPRAHSLIVPCVHWACIVQIFAERWRSLPTGRGADRPCVPACSSSRQRWLDERRCELRAVPRHRVECVCSVDAGRDRPLQQDARDVGVVVGRPGAQ